MTGPILLRKVWRTSSCDFNLESTSSHDSFIRIVSNFRPASETNFAKVVYAVSGKRPILMDRASVLENFASYRERISFPRRALYTTLRMARSAIVFVEELFAH